MRSARRWASGPINDRRVIREEPCRLPDTPSLAACGWAEGWRRVRFSLRSVGLRACPQPKQLQARRRGEGQPQLLGVDPGLVIVSSARLTVANIVAARSEVQLSRDPGKGGLRPNVANKTASDDVIFYGVDLLLDLKREEHHGIG